MRKFSYWLCFTLVAVPNVIGLVSWLLSLAGIPLPGVQTLDIFLWFGSLVPPMLAYALPKILSVLLRYALLALVARRVWLFFGTGERVPHSYVGTPKVLGYVGACSFILAAPVLVLSMVLHAGSGVPAGMLLLPAMFCVPWAFFLTELLSFRRQQRREV